MKLRILILTLGFLISLPANQSALAVSFQALGDLPGGNLHSFAYGVSGDGSTVVGRSFSSSGGEAFRWTQATGIVGLGDFPGGEFNSGATAVSFDGAVVMGWGKIAGSLQDQIFRWTQAGGMSFANVQDGNAALLANGSIVMGNSINVSAASNDGSVLVGYRSPFTPGPPGPVRWTQSGGLVNLVTLPNVTKSWVSNVSADGSVVVGYFNSVVGYFNSDEPQQAFKWTQAEGMVGLGGLPGDNFQSYAWAASANGSVIVGASHGYSGMNEAFIWDSSHGMRRLQTVLEELGLDLSGWLLETAYDISDDGRTIVGTAHNQSLNRAEAYIVVIPEPQISVLLMVGGWLLAGSMRRSRK